MKSLICKIFGRKPKTKNIDWKNISSVLIRPIGTGIGDAVVMSAVIGQLKQAYPLCKIGVLITQRNQFVFEHIPGVDICFQDKPITYFKQHKKWQVFLDYRPTFTTRNIICDYFLNPSYTICFEKTSKKNYSPKTVRNYNFYVPKLSAAHLSQSLTLTPFSDYVNTKKPRYNLDAPAANQKEIIKKWLNPQKLNILVCPLGSDKILDNNLLTQALSELEKKYRPNFIFAMDKTSYNLPKLTGITYTGKMPLETFFALCYGVDFILTVDTATVHIACAYNKPMVAIYSGYDDGFNLFYPLKQENIFAVRSAMKSNCPARDIDNWPVQDVLKYSKAFLSKIGK